jgi:TolB protein
MRKIILLGFVMVGMILPACSGPIVVFSSDRDGDEEIYTLSSDGGIWMQLTNNSDDDWAPAFSADGSRIAFSSDRDGNPEIYIMNADGTGQIRVTNHPDQDLEPKFSPDGSSLVFWSDRDAVSLGQFEIYLLDLASGTVTRLLISVSQKIPLKIESLYLVPTVRKSHSPLSAMETMTSTLWTQMGIMSNSSPPIPLPTSFPPSVLMVTPSRSCLRGISI